MGYFFRDRRHLQLALIWMNAPIYNKDIHLLLGWGNIQEHTYSIGFLRGRDMKNIFTSKKKKNSQNHENFNPG